MSVIFDDVMHEINEAFLDLYRSDDHIISVFLVGSMALIPYNERKYNDYDIRCAVNSFFPETFERVNRTVLQLVRKYKNNSEIGLASSDLVGPVNHHVTNKAHNILIHAMVHTIDDLIDFLPLTHKYMYGNGYQLICGRDILSELHIKDARYTLKDIIDGYEGINYCIEMISNRKHRYSRYEVIDGKCEFIPYEIDADEFIRHENCFYSVLKNLGNLRNYFKFSYQPAGESLYSFGRLILGEVNNDDNNLLEILLSKNEDRLEREYPNYEQDTVRLLMKIRDFIERQMQCE